MEEIRGNMYYSYSYVTKQTRIITLHQSPTHFFYRYVVEGPRAHEIYDLAKEDILAGSAAVSIKIPLLQANSKVKSKAKKSAKRRRKTVCQPKVNLSNNESFREVIMIEDD